MPSLSLRLLGPFAATLDRAPLGSFRSNKGQALLAYLAVEAALHPGQAARLHQREQVMDLLWPRLPRASAQVNLRQVVYQLRQLIPAVNSSQGAPVPFLLSERHTLVIHPDAVYELDLAAFLQLLAGGADPAALARAAALYRGDLLTDFYLPDSETFEEWAASRRAEFRRLALDALGRLADLSLAQAQVDAAARYAQRQLEIDNLRESAYRQLIIACAARGDRAEALRQAALCQELLARELGLDFTAETRQVVEAIRAGDLDSLPQPPVAPSGGCAHTLPLPASPLIGREQELTAITTFLRDPATRLMTITGEGGIGKTRLAIGAAQRLAALRPCPFPDGIHFIPLVSLSDPAHLIPALAAALLPALPRKDDPSLRRQLLDLLRGRHLLLVLDNFDHLLAGASLLTELLQQAPGLHFLVTSRERLRLSAEQVVPLQGLDYHGGPEVPAARLFLAAARRVRPGFYASPVDEPYLRQLCRLVEGMPLALELAATWVEVLPLSEIAARVAQGLGLLHADLRDLPERHRSMRAVFDASWQQLEPTEQALLAAISIFRGGFPRAAAETITGASLRSLSRLADRSLLHYDPARDRYHMHELLRQYAMEKLAAISGAAAEAHERHLRYYLSFAESIEPQLLAVTRPTWLDSLEAEHENMRVALEWALHQDDAESLARLAATLGVFWGIRGYLREGEKWLAAALARCAQLPPVACARLHFASGWLAFERGDYGTARHEYQESHRLMVTAGERGQIAELLDSLSHVAQQQGDFGQAARLAAESLALYQASGDQAGIATCLNRLGRLAELQGDPGQAVQLIERALDLRQQIGDERGMASSLNSLAELARFLGDEDRARQLYARSLSICVRLGDKRCVAGVNHNLGHVALRLGDTGQAMRHFRDSLLIYQELDNTEGMSLCLVGYAAACPASGAAARGVLLLSVATRLMREHGFVLTAADQLAYEQILERVRAAVDAATYSRQWLAGQSLPLPAAVERALALSPAGPS
jgi:predicted ATPase/DNA-binding SARP family transcriptional activator